MKKKKIIGMGFIIIFLFFFRLYYLNKDYPSKDKIEKYKIGETISYNNFDFKVSNYKIESNYGSKILSIDLDIINKSDEDQDSIDLVTSLIFYQNFSYSDIQNFEEGDFENRYEISYAREDFFFDPKEEKTFELKYVIEDENKGRENFIYLSKKLYEDEFKEYFDKKILLYRIIDLGDIYE